MNNIFCPKCGKETDTFFDNVCRECFIENIELIECPPVIHVKICPTCGSFFRKGKWVFKEDEEDAVLDSVRDALRIDWQADNPELIMSLQKLDSSRYRVSTVAKARIQNIPIDGSVETEVRIDWQTCDTCSRIAGGYFEGIVQIRADGRVPTQEELIRCENIARETAGSALEKGDRLAFISKTVELKEGIDLYVGLSKLGRQICRAVTEVFGGKFTESPKLAGRKDGVDLYRITFALRLPEFVRGDILNADGRVIEVQSCGKHIRGTDLETGKRFMEKVDNIVQLKKLAGKDDAVSAVLVADEGDTVQVLDPETYESVTIKKPGFLDTEPGNEVRIVKTGKGIYILP